MRYAVIAALLLGLSGAAFSQQDPTPVPPGGAVGWMTAERLGELVLRIDENAVQEGPTWFFVIGGLEAILIYDTNADRMRVMIPINDADDLPPEELMRLMQANFDSALDARYAIANNVLWGVFIHPLSTLSAQEFLLGVGQTANVVTSFGRGYSSGMFIFGGGDSDEIERNRLLEELKKLEEDST